MGRFHPNPTGLRVFEQAKNTSKFSFISVYDTPTLSLPRGRSSKHPDGGTRCVISRVETGYTSPRASDI